MSSVRVEGGERSRRDVRAACLRWLALGLAAFLLLAWFLSVAQSADPELALRRDWTAFQQAGSLLLQGRTAEIYSTTFEGGYFFFHPPFALLPCALFGLVPSTFAGYGLALAVEVLALVATLVLLRRMLPAPAGVHATVAAIVLASAPWIGVVATGQTSALLVLALAAGFLLWQRGMPLRAGLVLALLFAKPNLALPLLGLALLSGRWRVLFGMLCGLALLLLVAAPLGTDVWSAWWTAMLHRGGDIAAEDSLLWKQPTLFAFFQTVLPRTPAWIAWAVTTTVLFGFLVRVWRTHAERNLPRVLSATVLFLVACNPHLFFYDGLLLLIPGAVWATSRESFTGSGARRACGVFLALVYVSQHLATLWLQARCPPVQGPLLAAWLVVELADLSRAPADVPGSAPAATGMRA